jgi:hypothetical protein
MPGDITIPLSATYCDPYVKKQRLTVMSTRANDSILTHWEADDVSSVGCDISP